LQDAITFFEKSRALNPGFVLNYLELSKAYYRIDQKKKAKELLGSMLQLPDLTIDDPHIKEEGRSLLLSWKD